MTEMLSTIVCYKKSFDILKYQNSLHQKFWKEEFPLNVQSDCEYKHGKHKSI